MLPTKSEKYFRQDIGNFTSLWSPFWYKAATVLQTFSFLGHGMYASNELQKLNFGN